MLKLSQISPGLALLMALGAVPARSVSTDAPRVTLAAQLGEPVLSAGKSHTTFLKVGLTGQPRKEAPRAPVNIALVIDTSGSMEGENLARAKEAAKYAIRRLQKEDIVSLVTYGDTAEVLVPAAPLTDPQAVIRIIDGLVTNGSTALFAGISLGAAELRRFRSQERINRLILLSDGQANIGPSTPAELGNFGASLIKEGVSVTTLGMGLGYNEDLMTQLALKSDGNHAFVQKPEDLTRFFDLEFGDVLSVVAQEVTVKIDFLAGVRPVRTLGREAEIDEKSAFALINQLYSGHEKYVLIEVTVPAGQAGSSLEIARIRSTYMNLESGKAEEVETTCSVSFSDSLAAVEKSANKTILSSVAKQRANVVNEEAVKLRDEGKLEEAKQLLYQNAVDLRTAAEKYDDDSLRSLEQTQMHDASNLGEADWGRQRKQMLKTQQMTIQDARY